MGNWKPLAEWYAEDATYGWMYSPDEQFMAVGREQIRDLAIGQEMKGLDGWHYDYQATVIDAKTQMIVGFWKQRSGIVDDETGEEYEIVGIGGSWFGVEQLHDRTLRFAWQRDWFDLGSTAHTFFAIASSGKAPPELLERMAMDGKTLPGHYRLQDLPSSVWPPPVESGDYLEQKSRPVSQTEEA
jgi:hypothetical protein